MSEILNNGHAVQLAAQDHVDLPVIATSSAALILDSASMDSMMRLAEIMAKGRATVPEHLRGNIADCAAVVMQAIQWRMNPFAVAQKTHLVNGALGYEAQLVNAVIQSSGVTADRFSYEWYGPWEKIIGKTKVIDMPAKDGKKAYQFRVPDYDMRDEVGLGVRAWATMRGEMEPRVIDLMLVQASVRNSPLWATDPKQQLAYLAVKRWSRLYSPDVILGVYTPDELDDGAQNPRDITPAARNSAPDKQPVEASPELNGRASMAASKGVAEYQKFWAGIDNADRKALFSRHDALKSAAVAADKSRTIDAAEPAPDASEDMAGMVADLLAVADDSAEAFADAWYRLSAATQGKLMAASTALADRARAATGAKK